MFTMTARLAMNRTVGEKTANGEAAFSHQRARPSSNVKNRGIDRRVSAQEDALDWTCSVVAASGGHLKRNIRSPR